MDSEINPYQPTTTDVADETPAMPVDVPRRWPIARAPISWAALLGAIWISWVLWIVYDPKYSGSDSLVLLVFGATVGLILAKWLGGRFVRKVAVAMGAGLLAITAMLVLTLFRRSGATSFRLEALVLIPCTLAGFLPVIVVTAAVLGFLGRVGSQIGWQARQHDSGGFRPVASWVVVRAFVILTLLISIHMLEAGTLGVRLHWFHDFCFVDPWLWLSAPLAFGLSGWAIQPFFSGPLSVVKRIAWLASSSTIAVVLLIATLPLSGAVSVLVDPSSEPASKWLSLNLVLATAWYARSVLDLFREVRGAAS